jgi:hypothetical protein
MHIYAFGSIVRGEISPGSDVDLLTVIDGYDQRFEPDIFSIYSYNRIRELWKEGNPFAWHLSLESKLLYSHDGSDFLAQLGPPCQYKSCLRDCEKFLTLFQDAQKSILLESNSLVFDLSIVFLSIRNFASCFSLGVTDRPNFSRHSSLSLRDDSIPISKECYAILERARILSTRGYGSDLSRDDVALVLRELEAIRQWMNDLLKRVTVYERIQ